MATMNIKLETEEVQAVLALLGKTQTDSGFWPLRQKIIVQASAQEQEQARAQLLAEAKQAEAASAPPQAEDPVDAAAVGGTD